MKPDARRSPLLFLVWAASMQLVRRPYLSLSVAAHAALLALLYYFGRYQPTLRQQEVEVASSLRATHHASAARRLQDLQTIKQLLEKSADRVDAPPEPGPATAPAPETAQDLLAQARELSRAIDTLDQEIRAAELAELTGVPKPPPAAEPSRADPSPAEPPQAAVPQAAMPPSAAPSAAVAQPPVTPEMADREIAALEARARATLARRQQRLEAKANGVPVEGEQRGPGGQGAGTRPPAAREQGRPADASARAEIAEFIAAGERLEQVTRSSKKYAGGEFFDRGRARIPPVDASGLVRGHGRMFGAGGQYANRVVLNSWYLIGPFPGRHEAGLFDNPSYPPEKAVLLDAVYHGKDKRLLKWRYVTAPSYPLVPPDMVEDSVYYGYTEVHVDQACDLTAWIGADDDVQIYLNDRLVWKGGNVNKQSYFDAIFNAGAAYLRDYNRTEGQRVLHFNQGRNRLFFKLSNGPNSAFLSMVLTR